MSKTATETSLQEASSTVELNKIYIADNLPVLENMDSESVDLIYLDPPFNSNKVYRSVGGKGDGAGFRDEMWSWEHVDEDAIERLRKNHEYLYDYIVSTIHKTGGKKMMAYIAYMAQRLMEMHRVLKPTGSIYLHCDPTASHYLKVVMDGIFGAKNFRNDIIFRRSNGGKGTKNMPRSYARNHDNIFFYTKTKDYFLVPFRNFHDEVELKKLYPKVDKTTGRRYEVKLHWCGKSQPNSPGNCYEWRGYKNPYPSGWAISKEALEEEYQQGLIFIGKNGGLQRRRYLTRNERVVRLDSIWDDLNIKLNSRKEYVTQKPLALLERIIEASTKEGDIVLDPFCGSATACVAAQNLGRKWIGIELALFDDKALMSTIVDRFEKGVKELFIDRVDSLSLLPKRKEKTQPKRAVYVISNPAFDGKYKVGIASNVEARLNGYQTSDPERGYKVEYSKWTSHAAECEKHIHAKFNADHEWVTGDLTDIIDAIEAYCHQE